MDLSPQQFSKRVLAWFDQHGRTHLPWQQDITPYRVWVSEIMLQQTQVNTVIPYFERFMAQFPTIKSLANAKEDEILHLWTGLGYYARARNLQRTAKIIQSQYAGEFPRDLESLQQLPGIGRSTAGAILAIAMRQRAAILDGNVKRVLTRLHAITGWPGEAKVLKQLWEYAERYTPAKRTAAYTQAMMDLGATICTRSSPACLLCPLQTACKAHAEGKASVYPTRKATKDLPIRSTRMLIIRNSRGDVLLEKRPPVGIWGGLWGFPQLGIEEDIERWCQKHLAHSIKELTAWSSFRHTFSHFHLDITPVLITTAKSNKNQVLETATTVWYNIDKPDARGLAAPVKQLLEKLRWEKTHDATHTLCKA